MIKLRTPVGDVRAGQTVLIDDMADHFHRGFDGWMTVLRCYPGRPTEIDRMLCWQSPNPTNAAYVDHAMRVPANDRGPAGVSMLLVDQDSHQVHVVYFPSTSTSIDVFAIAIDEAA